MVFDLNLILDCLLFVLLPMVFVTYLGWVVLVLVWISFVAVCLVGFGFLFDLGLLCVLIFVVFCFWLIAGMCFDCAAALSCFVGNLISC